MRLRICLLRGEPLRPVFPLLQCLRHISVQHSHQTLSLFGQDWNDEAWAVCKSDMLIKGEDADNIRLGDTFTQPRKEAERGRTDLLLV